MYITADMLQSFTEKYVNEDQLPLMEAYCRAAEKKIEHYLGWNPEPSEKTVKARGNGGFYFDLRTRGFMSFTAAKINGIETDVSVFDMESDDRRYAVMKDGTAFFRNSLYEITFTQGFEEMPADIVTCALQIATLYMESAGGNLAVSSTSYADSGTRVFNNFKAERFLENIWHYKIAELM